LPHRKLLSRDWSGAGNVLGLHGPAEQPTFGESARILGEVIGRPVELVALPMEAWKQSLLGMGFPQAIADGYEELMGAIGRGEKPAEPRTAETTTPTNFREWAEQVVRPAAEAFRASAPAKA
jgi:hypothetical protein